MVARFELGEFYKSIDSERENRGLSWAALSRQVGVSAATIRRYAQAEDAEADGVLALIRWLDAAPEDFIVGAPHLTAKRKPLASLDNGATIYVRVDMALVAKAAGDKRSAAGRTRTTIARLVEAAEQADRPVATLTRLTDC